MNMNDIIWQVDGCLPEGLNKIFSELQFKTLAFKNNYIR